MTPLTYDEATERHPDLVNQVLSQLAESRPDLDPDLIRWFTVTCGADPGDLMDEAAIAEHLMTGLVPCQIGVAAIFDGTYRCACHCEAVEPGTM